MHDIDFIRKNTEAFIEGLNKRGISDAQAKAGELLNLDASRRSSQTGLDQLKARKNQINKEIGMVKSKGGNADHLFAEAKQINEQIAAFENKKEINDAVDDSAEKLLNEKLSLIPNIPADDVPVGKSEHDNKEVRKHGTPPTIANAKEHFDLGEQLGLMDFEAAARMSGSRFVVLKGELARLERALASFMLDIHTREFGYTEILPPYLVRDNALYGTGQLPKFAEDLFSTPTGHWLIPTSEVPLTNLVNDQILSDDQLPLRFTAYSPCFRSEAGAAGKDTRGMIRQHQFSKVELVSITTPEQSSDEHERMTQCAEEILKRLGLAYRTMLLCTGDMGFSAQKTYDMEVWLPGQNAYREISSCSNCGAFQARRMKARFKRKDGKSTEFVHTLNGSGLAIGRTMIAIMENYQQPDGSIAIPDALQPYMGGLKTISK